MAGAKRMRVKVEGDDIRGISPLNVRVLSREVT